MQLILSRHGATEYNLQRKFYGTTDVDLAPLGVRQAQELAQKVAPFEPTKIINTPLQRTAQTIAPYHQTHLMVPIITIPEWMEKGFGAWEGLDADQIQAHYPQEWQRWLAAPLTYTPPESESFADFQQRVAAGWQMVKQVSQPNDRLWIVTHLGTLRILAQLLGEQRAFYDIDFPAGTLTILTLDAQAQIVTQRVI